MNRIKIIDLVKDNQRVTFDYFRDNEFWYKTDSGFIFSIPLDDIQGQKLTLPSNDKAILYIRWIKRFIENSQQ